MNSNNTCLYLVFMLMVGTVSVAQVPQIKWQQCIGGTYDEAGVAVLTRSGGKVYLVGNTTSVNGVSIHNHGSSDIFVCEFDSLGNMKWRKCYGGSRDDRAFSAVTCRDGGLIVAGQTRSFDGDVQGFHFGPNDDFDGWVIKLDSNGNIQWSRCLGGSRDEGFGSVVQLSDGSFLCGGQTSSSDGDVSGNHDSTSIFPDAWVVKLNVSGNIIRQKCYGNSSSESVFSIIETSTNNYCFAGYSSDTGGVVPVNHGSHDTWFFITDSSGNMLVSQSYGGSQEEIAKKVFELHDGFLVVGNTNSIDGDVTGNHSGAGSTNNDVWLLKINFQGTILWSKCLGGSLNDLVNEAVRTGDKGFLLTGRTSSSDGDLFSNYGFNDAWLIKLDSTGNLVWNVNMGGSSSDEGMSVAESNGNYYLCSTTNSNDNQVSMNNGNEDIWLVKLEKPVSVPEVLTPTNPFTVFPNPSAGKITLKYNPPYLLKKPSLLQLINSDGTVIKEQYLLNSTDEINAEEIEKGIYILRLINCVSGEFRSQKIIIQ